MKSGVTGLLILKLKGVYIDEVLNRQIYRIFVKVNVELEDEIEQPNTRTWWYLMSADGHLLLLRLILTQSNGFELD